jgi:hypothetical protein
LIVEQLGVGGLDQPNISLTSVSLSDESYVYLSQIPYTGIPESVWFFFRLFSFGILFYLYYIFDDKKLIFLR